MFYRNRIKKLEDEIQLLKFKIENPPKYKVGDKTKQGAYVVEVVPVINGFKYIKLGYKSLPVMKKSHWEYLVVKPGVDKTERIYE